MEGRKLRALLTVLAVAGMAAAVPVLDQRAAAHDGRAPDIRARSSGANRSEGSLMLSPRGAVSIHAILLCSTILGLLGAGLVRIHQVRFGRARRRIEEQAALATAVNQCLPLLVTNCDPKVLFEEIERHLRQLSESRLGLLAEVRHSPSGRPYITTHAVGSANNECELAEFLARDVPADLDSRRFENPLSRVIATGQAVLSNCPAAEFEAVRAHPGRSELSLSTFLGLPIYHGSKLVGVVALADRPDGYPQELADDLRPLLAVCGAAIGWYRGDIRRRQAESEVKERERFLRLVLDNIPHRIWWKDLRGVYLGGNEAFAADAGVKSAEGINGKTDYDLPWTREEAEAFRAADRRVREADTPECHAVETQRRADGSRCQVAMNRIPLHDAGGRVIGLLGTYEDITEQKRMEEDLLRIGMAVEAIGDGVGITDAAGRYIYQNQALTNMLGCSIDEINASGGPRSIFTESRLADQVLTAAQNGGSWVGEADLRHRSGRVLRVSLRAYAIRHRDNSLLGSVGVVTDITAIKQGERDMRDRLEMEGLLASTSARFAGLAPGEADGAIMQSLQALSRYFGTDRGYLVRLSEHNTRLIITHEWCAEGIASRKAAFENLPAGHLQQWMKALRQREAVQVPRAAEVRAACMNEGGHFVAEDARALIFVPLYNGRTLQGLLEFDSVRTERYWADRDVALLKTLADIISNAIARCQSEQTLQDKATALTAANMELEAQKQYLQAQQHELRATNEELERAWKEAQAASRVKSDFLVNMSHELRTPMTAVLGFSETLQDESLPDVDRREAVKAISRNGRLLMDLLNDILDLSKIEAGLLPVESRPCSLAQLMTEIVSLIESQAAERGLTFRVENETPIPDQIRTDALRLRQVLLKILGNAVKFTERGSVRLQVRAGPPDGTVRAGAEHPPAAEREDADSVVQFDVIDTGIGMTTEQVARLFQPFTQADSSAARRFGGTGLGLSISQRLARLLGGDVQLIETGEGVGTHFRVCIPVQLVNSGCSPDDLAETPAPTPAAPPASTTPESMRLPPCRLLLVEDGLDNQRLIAHLLRKAGAEVELADNGRIGVEKARRAVSEGHPHDLILMDMQMPEMDGYEATRVLRSEGYTRPIVAVTAHAMTADREKCLAAGCNDYATKPVERKRLIEMVMRQVAAEAVTSPG